MPDFLCAVDLRGNCIRSRVLYSHGSVLFDLQADIPLLTVNCARISTVQPHTLIFMYGTKLYLVFLCTFMNTLTHNCVHVIEYIDTFIHEINLSLSE